MAGTPLVSPATTALADDCTPGVSATRWRLWHLSVGLVLPMALIVWNMVAVRAFTVDDAYISFRYARNLSRGLGLVYNVGERVEGYTNFLWTVLIAAGFKLNLHPEIVAKWLGGGAACVSLGMVYVLSRRIRPFGVIPCVATWLMATSMVQTGYAMFGLETAFFTCLVLVGLELLLRERDRGRGFPFSAVAFGLAGLTRPEAPMFIGLPMLFLGRGIIGRQNVLRGLVFTAIVGAHLLWRHAYYGSWLPNTLSAKTGDIVQQLRNGRAYFLSYGDHAIPAMLLTVLGVCALVIFSARQRRGQGADPVVADTLPRVNLKDGVCLLTLMAFVAAYVMLVGGDWMPYYRFLAPFEPFAFVIACLGARAWGESALALAGSSVRSAASPQFRRTVAGVAVALVLSIVGAVRTERLLSAQESMLRGEKAFWDSAAGGVAYWLVTDGQQGEVALGDIGFVGYETDYPILDLLGLVDPVISKLPGGYTRKTGSGYVARVFDKSPKYFVFVGTADCRRMAFPAQEELRLDPRFQGAYRLAGAVRHTMGGVWCIFERHAPPGPQARAGAAR